MNSWGKIVKDRKCWENKMEKKFELDDELDKLLDEQLIREAELLEKELLRDEDSEPYTETEEEMHASYESLLERLKADGVYREDAASEEPSEKTSENEKKTVEILSLKTGGTQKIFGRVRKRSPRKENMTEEEKHRRRRRISAKIAGVVVVSGMCVFAASMTSEANRNYFMHSVKIMTGRDTRVVNGNDEANDRVDADEYAAIAEIEEKLGIEMPELYYRPYNFSFVSYEVDVYAEIAWVEYEYEENNIFLCISKSDDENISNMSGMIGEEVQNVTMEYEDVNVNIIQIMDINDESSGYYAKWKRKDVEYSLYGRMQIEEFCKIVEKIAY